MRCGKCPRRLRYDEVNRQLDDADGMHSACPHCHAEARGEVYTPPVYPKGCRMPRHPKTDGDLPICGLCRRALFWGEQPTPLRVPDNDEGVEPGLYPCCRECVEHWRPAVRARLAREVSPHYAGAPLSSIDGNNLL